MATINLKYRSSTVPGKPGAISIYVIHNRKVKYINSDCKVFDGEFDHERGELVFPDDKGSERYKALLKVKERLDCALEILQDIVTEFGKSWRKFSADDIVKEYERRQGCTDFCQFMDGLIAQFKEWGKHRLSETYQAAKVSFLKFRQGDDIAVAGITSELMVNYEAWLQKEGCSKNTVSFYMRILRAAYNRGVEKGLAQDKKPFSHVYTGIDKTRKRAIDIRAIKKMKELDLSRSSGMTFARDMFLFSFYTRGMSFVDMAYLKKKDLHNGVLTYKRRKTGQQLSIRWEQCMGEIVCKHPSPPPPICFPSSHRTRTNENSIFTRRVWSIIICGR